MSDGDYSAPLTVQYTVSGSAAANSDYWSFTGSLTFYGGLTTGEGVTTQKLIVRPLDDYHAFELTETVIITLSGGPGYTVGTPNSATVAIASNDIPPGAGDMVIPHSNISPITVDEGGGSSSYMITLNEQPTYDVTITLSTPGPNAQVSLVTSGPLVFTPQNWNQPQGVTFFAVNDTVNEVTAHPGVIRNSAASGDPRYNGEVKDIQVTVRDNEADLQWDPSLSILPPGFYQEVDLGISPSNWSAMLTYNDEIRELHIVPPTHPIVYVSPLDFEGFHSAYTATLQFHEPGIYVARVDFNGGRPPETRVFFVGAAEGRTEADAAHAQTRYKVAVPNPILTQPGDKWTNLVELTGRDNGYIDVAAAIRDPAHRPPTVTAAIAILKAEYIAAAVKPLRVVLVGHGNSKQISIGAGMLAPPPADKGLYEGQPDLARFVSELTPTENGVKKQYVKELNLWGCNVAQRIEVPTHFMNELSGGLSIPGSSASVGGFDACVQAIGGGRRDRHFSVPQHAHWRVSNGGVPQQPMP